MRDKTFSQWLIVIKELRIRYDEMNRISLKKQKIGFARHCMMQLVTKPSEHPGGYDEISGYDIMRINQILKKYE